MAYSETHIPVLLAEAGAVWRGASARGAGAPKWKQQTKTTSSPAYKEQPCFAGFLSQSVHAYICGFLCACAAGPGGGEWGGPSREGARTCLHILNGNCKENHQRCSHIHLAAPTITAKSPPSFHKHFIYIFKWEYFCSFGKRVPLCGWVCLICALRGFFQGWEARVVMVAKMWGRGLRWGESLGTCGGRRVYERKFSHCPGLGPFCTFQENLFNLLKKKKKKTLVAIGSYE